MRKKFRSFARRVNLPPNAMARSRSPQKILGPAHEIVWRGGLHLRGTALWFDCDRSDGAVFLSHAGSVRRIRKISGGARQLIGTPATLSALAESAPIHKQDALLSVPLYHRFTLGPTSLELIPSGVLPQSASIFLEHNDVRILYVHSIAQRGLPWNLSADMRRVDVLCLGPAVFQKTFPAEVPWATAEEQLHAALAKFPSGPTAIFVDDEVLTGAVIIALQKSATGSLVMEKNLKRVAVQCGVVAESWRRTLAKDPKSIVIWPKASEARFPWQASNHWNVLSILRGQCGLGLARENSHTIENIGWSADLTHVAEFAQQCEAQTVYVCDTQGADNLAQLLANQAKVVYVGPPAQMQLLAG